MNHARALAILLAQTERVNQRADPVRCYGCGRAMDDHADFCRPWTRARRILARWMREASRQQGRM